MRGIPRTSGLNGDVSRTLKDTIRAVSKWQGVRILFELMGARHLHTVDAQAESNLGPRVGAWHPHIMVYAPYYTNTMLGNNQCGGTAPCVVDDAGTPFTVLVIPVHGNEAIKAKRAAALGASSTN